MASQRNCFPPPFTGCPGLVATATASALGTTILAWVCTSLELATEGFGLGALFSGRSMPTSTMFA